MLSQTMATSLDTETFTKARRVFNAHKERLPQDALHLLTREVISRLALDRSTAADPVVKPSSEDIDALCHDLLSPCEMQAADKLIALRGQGASLDMLYRGYLAAAARRLGDWWTEDRTTFTEVTIAAGRIYAIMRSLTASMPVSLPRDRQHALFASVPGETHTLGVTMAADLFRERGWHIDLETGKGHDELVRALDRTHHSIIGLSTSRPEMIAPLARLIVAFRICKPQAFIMVCGAVAESEPDICDLVDADCIANDLPTAIRSLEKFFAREPA